MMEKICNWFHRTRPEVVQQRQQINAAIQNIQSATRVVEAEAAFLKRWVEQMQGQNDELDKQSNRH